MFINYNMESSTNPYYIPGASDVSQQTNESIANLPDYPNFQQDLLSFQSLICNLVDQKKGASFVHFGDGDYYFLKKIPIGSATPGKRALSIPYHEFNIEPFRTGWDLADYHCVEYLERQMKPKYNELFSDWDKTIATEFLYGCTANRWFTKTFRGKIGLIGAKEKLDVIQELMKHKEVQEYYGLEDFNDYIYIPQKFACDNLEETFEMVREQLKHANPDTQVFLFGVGHVKSGLIHKLPSVKQAIYLDIGGGIDALAGIIDPERPYSFEWINHRMTYYNYGSLDYLNYVIHKDKNIRYIDEI